MMVANGLVRLVGIARLAAESNLLVEKRRVEYRNLPTRKWLNRCQSDRVPFHWTINPYRGCEFGCKYCYARFTHEFLERRDLAAFETEIYAKDWNADAFREELKQVRPGQIIGIGTATDPYQPAERKFKLTRHVLEVLLPLEGASLFLTTKSNLVSRDIDLFRQLAKRNKMRVTVTVTTTNRKIARLTEPYAPSPDLRLKAVAELAAAGVTVGVAASPILPLITDSKASLLAVAKAAKDAGASQFWANVVFLQPSAQKVFFPFLADEFPDLLGRYQKSFRSSAYLEGTYPERMKEMVQEIREQFDFEARDAGERFPVAPPELANSQMFLF